MRQRAPDLQQVAEVDRDNQHVGHGHFPWHFADRQAIECTVRNAPFSMHARGSMLNAPRKPPKTAFKPGWKGGPGRPPGMRNRLTEVALQMLGDDFSEHGAETIAKVRREKPHVYLQVVASLLPRQVQTEKLSPLSDITDEELHQIEELLAASRAKLVRKVEQQNGAASFPPASPKTNDIK